MRECLIKEITGGAYLKEEDSLLIKASEVVKKCSSVIEPTPFVDCNTSISISSSVDPDTYFLVPQSDEEFLFFKDLAEKREYWEPDDNEFIPVRMRIEGKIREVFVEILLLPLEQREPQKFARRYQMPLHDAIEKYGNLVFHMGEKIRFQLGDFTGSIHPTLVSSMEVTDIADVDFMEVYFNGSWIPYLAQTRTSHAISYGPVCSGFNDLP